MRCCKSTLVLLTACAMLPEFSYGQPKSHALRSALKSSHAEPNLILKRYDVSVSAEADAGSDVSDDRAQIQEPAEASFLFSETASAEDQGAEPDTFGEAQSSCAVTAAYEAESDTLTLFTSMSGTSSAQNGSDDGAAPFAETAARFHADFDVDTAPVLVLLEGQQMSVATGAAPSYAQVRLEIMAVPSVGEPPYRRVVMATGGSDEAMIEETVVLEPGSYQFRIRADTESYFDDDADLGLRHAQSRLSVNIVLSPVPAGEVVWIAGDGTFDDAENWEPDRVPALNDTARFGDGGSYQVTFGAEEALRAVIDDDVRFAGGSFTLHGGSLTDPSLAVAPESNVAGELVLDFHQLSSPFAAIAPGLGSTGHAAVINGSTWTCSERLDVGESGTGTLDVFAGGQVDAGSMVIGTNAQATGVVRVEGSASGLETGELTVGSFGTGTLEVDGTEISTGETVVGALFDSSGTVRLTGSPDDTAWVFSGPVVVGGEGAGELDIDGALLTSSANDDILFAQTDGSTAVLFIEGSGAGIQSFGGVHFGVAGDATGFIGPGALVGCDWLTIGPIEPNGGAGSLSVEGTPLKSQHTQIDLDGGPLVVGERGRGVLALDDSADLFCGQAHFALGGGGEATVTLRGGSAIMAQGEVLAGSFVEPGEPFGIAFVRVYGNSVIDADLFVIDRLSALSGNGAVLVNSFESNGAVISPALDIVDGAAKNAGAVAGATLTIDGDFSARGGELQFDVGGTGPGAVDLLHITGTAAIEGATIILNFTDGYLPGTGESAPVVRADAGLTATDLTLQFEGVADGFDFTVQEDGGVLTFHALNDAQPLPAGPGDVNGDGAVNAVDVQIVVNVLLGLDGFEQAYDADVDGSGSVDAVDVQLVILAALGIDITEQTSSLAARAHPADVRGMYLSG